jgi:formyl-CoA transferase
VVLGVQDDERFSDYAAMTRNGDALDDLLLAWIAERDRPTVLAELANADIPVAPVNDAHGVLTDEQLLARGDIVTALHEVLGQVSMLASPAWIDGWRAAPEAAGFNVGQHNVDVYGELLGLAADDLEVLADDGVI